MNRVQRRALERKLRKIGPQALPSGRVVSARELYRVMQVIWVRRGESVVDGVIAQLTSGDPEAENLAGAVIEDLLLVIDGMRRKAPDSLEESE